MSEEGTMNAERDSNGVAIAKGKAGRRVRQEGEISG
ncbi:MAG: hypothetical protein HW395_710 [candidate division NC10 bacterium]|jgi:hypothetical protein|nr:hypothetical protein [candidate division NC10 bacterium]